MGTKDHRLILLIDGGKCGALVVHKEVPKIMAERFDFLSGGHPNIATSGFSLGFFSRLGPIRKDFATSQLE